MLIAPKQDKLSGRVGRVKAEVRSTFGVAPHFDVVSFRKILLHVKTLALVLLTCSLNVKLRSRVTPRYTGWTQC